jgi:hypothetical protein
MTVALVYVITGFALIITAVFFFGGAYESARRG